MERDAAAQKVFPGKLEKLRPAWELIDEFLVSRGLSRDVKTIYVSYTTQGGEVAAAAHPDLVTISIEVALAIDPTLEHPMLYDATHLKWRTLPQAVRLTSVEDVSDQVEELLDLAIAHAGTLSPRPPEEFIGRRRRGRFEE